MVWIGHDLWHPGVRGGRHDVDRARPLEFPGDEDSRTLLFARSTWTLAKWTLAKWTLVPHHGTHMHAQL